MYLYAKLKNLTPWHVLIIIAVGAWLLAAFQPDMIWAARGVLVAGALLAAFNPRNGLFLTLLACPFLLGEPQDPFLYLIDGLAAITILAWLAHLVAARRRPDIPYLWLILLLAGLIVVNVPVNLKELMTALDLLDGGQIWRLLVEGRKFHDLFALRSVAFHLGGLAFLACCLDLLRPHDLKPLGLSLLIISLVLTVFSLAWWLGWLERNGFYLSLNLTGVSERHGEWLLASTAFNRQYFNELLVFPLAVAGGLILWGRRLGRCFALAAAGLMLALMTLTGQRSPFVCLGAMLLAAAALAVWVSGRKALRPAMFAVLGGLLVLATLLGLDFILAGGHLANRFLGLTSGDAVAGIGSRPQVWAVAAAMFAAFPLTGAGPGTFRLLAREFTEAAGLNWTPDLIGVLGTAHNTFMHWAAELGLIVGLGLLLLAGLLVGSGLRSFWAGRRRIEAGVILVGLTGLIVFGVFQHITYLTSIALLILAGLAGLAKIRPENAPPPWRPRTAPLVAVGLALAVLMVWLKVSTIAERPFRDKWQAGFSYGELQLADNREAWWTTGVRAAKRELFYRPMTTQVRLPHPIVKTRPQRVVFKIDGQKAGEITLRDTDWHQVRLELEKYPDRPTILTIETDYAFCPFAYDGNPDRRWLSVQIKDFRFVRPKPGS